jgi:predicted AAA+ superfamily ATPase
VASGYVEQLSDLLSVLPIWPYDHMKRRFQPRKPAKFPFINLAVAIAFHPRGLRQVHEFSALPGEDKAILLEWLVAQELWRRSVLAGRENPEEIGCWRSRDHEIDFVDPSGTFVEVKLGKAPALEFSWFAAMFPDEELVVVCTTPFEGRTVRGMTIHDILFHAP